MGILRNKQGRIIGHISDIAGTKCKGCDRILESGKSSRGMCSKCYQRWQLKNVPHEDKYKYTCKNCGVLFFSRYKKAYCTLKCYISSNDFKERTLKQAKEMTIANRKKSGYSDPTKKFVVKCRNCGADIVTKKAHPKTYCNNVCRREYFNSRFDRYIANPETIALPQNYDEFLDRHILPCLIDGCDWEGKNLSNHMNFSHGIPAEKFKEIAGFNDGTGVISKDTALKLSKRLQMWTKENPPISAFHSGRTASIGKRATAPRLEGKEHHQKSHALLKHIDPETYLLCKWCGVKVQQKYFGKKLYCSTQCRSKYYRAGKKTHDIICTQCGKVYKGDIRQSRRQAKGLVVACSIVCRQKLNSNRGVNPHKTRNKD